MPRTINEGFVEFHRRLTPTKTELAAVQSHRAQIEACLKTNYAITRFWRTGSFGNGTSIVGQSDTDYFAVIPDSNISNNSTLALTQVKKTLWRRFPKTGVCVRRPAVQVPFGTRAAETTEVVPAVIGDSHNGHSVYLIPSHAGDIWMSASPDAHNAYVRNQHQRLKSKVKPLVRFLKAWKYLNRVPISSFYLEMRVAKFAATEESIIYSIDVAAVFSHLEQVGLVAIRDPTGVSGLISACISDATKKQALSKLATAALRARKARYAEEGDNVKSAFSWWNKLFGGQFPNY